jgi:hypothetical protein
MALSTYQTAIVNEIIAGTSNIVVDAKAGAGKSFTIMQGFKALKQAGFSQQCLLMAFNKNIQKELEAKVANLGASNFVTVKTFHSVGYSALRSIGRSSTIGSKTKPSPRMITSFQAPFSSWSVWLRMQV